MTAPTVDDWVPTWRGRLPFPFLVDAINRRFDQLVRPVVTVAGRRMSAFLLCGYVGLAVAVVISQVVVAEHGLSPLVMAVVTVTAIVTFLLLVMVATVVVGREVIVYYHHEVAVLVTTGTVLWAIDQPVLAYHDAVVLGVGGFLACGRVGCLLVGCCHGRPARLGARYGDEHAAEGFTAGYVGVRLLPVPLVEAVAVMGIVGVGLAQVLTGAPAGWALAWYVVSYGAVRSWLELVRGDPGRPHLWGLSQAQVTALVLVTGSSAAVWVGLVPGPPVACGVALAVTGASVAVAVTRRRRAGPLAAVVAPRHLAEVALLVRRLVRGEGRGDGPDLRVAGPTSSGVLISATADHGALCHYGLSVPSSELPHPVAVGLARAILRAHHPEVPAARLLKGHNGVHHVVLVTSDVHAGPSAGLALAGTRRVP